MISRSYRFSIILIICLCAAYSLFLLRQALATPWVGDDIEYQYLSLGEPMTLSDKPIESVGDIMVSQWNHYFSINGRSPAHCVIQFFCGIAGRLPFAIITPFFSLLLLCLVIRLSRQSLSSPIAWIMALTLIMIPQAISITPVLQINYVWAYCLMLWFSVIWLRNDKTDSWLCGLLAFVAGWMQESLGIGLCAGMFIHLLVNKDVSHRRWVLWCCFTVGLMFICLSPAAWHRVSDRHIEVHQSLMMLVLSMRVTWLFIIALLASHLFVLIPTKQFLRDNIMWLTSVVTLIAFNIIIGVETSRQLLGAEICSAILLMQLIGPIIHSRRCLRIGVCGLMLCLCGYIGWRRITFVDETATAYSAIMNKALAAHDGDVVKVDYCIGEKPWPGDNHLQSLEKLVFTQQGKHIRFQSVR